MNDIKFNDGYFRMLVMGKSNSGKTYFLLNELLPILVKKYTMFYVFTVEYNIGVFKKVLTKLGVDPVRQKLIKVPDTSMIPYAVQAIETAIIEDKTGEDEDGHTTFRDHSLLIFDDLLDDNVMQSTVFRNLFTRSRHMQMSVIMISQISTRAVTPAMKANTTYNVIFKMPGTQSRYAIELISDSIEKALLMKNKTGNDHAIRQMASKLYLENCENVEFGHLIITDDGKIHIFRPMDKK